MFNALESMLHICNVGRYRVKCHQATASDLPFYDIFAPQKVTFSKISDNVIECDLWFGPHPNQKSWLRLWLILFFIKSFIYGEIYMYILVGA